jgi:hypothetical protein
MDSSSIISNANLNLMLDGLGKEEVVVKSKKKHIPSFIKQTLNCWTGKFSIANPGKRYQSGCISEYKLGIFLAPIRQLKYLGISKHFVVLQYKKGGFAACEKLLIFKINNGRVVDFWTGYSYGVDLKSKEDIIKYLPYITNVTRTNIESL